MIVNKRMIVHYIQEKYDNFVEVSSCIEYPYVL